MKLKIQLLLLMSCLTLSIINAQGVNSMQNVFRRIPLTKLGLFIPTGYNPFSLDGSADVFEVVQDGETILISAMNDCGEVSIEITSPYDTVYIATTNLFDGSVVEIPTIYLAQGEYTIYIHVRNSTYVGTFVI